MGINKTSSKTIQSPLAQLQNLEEGAKNKARQQTEDKLSGRASDSSNAARVGSTTDFLQNPKIESVLKSGESARKNRKKVSDTSQPAQNTDELVNRGKMAQKSRKSGK